MVPVVTKLEISPLITILHCLMFLLLCWLILDMSQKRQHFGIYGWGFPTFSWCGWVDSNKAPAKKKKELIFVTFGGN